MSYIFSELSNLHESPLCYRIMELEPLGVLEGEDEWCMVAEYGAMATINFRYKIKKAKNKVSVSRQLFV